MVLLKIAVVLGLIGLSGFFVAAEYALLTVRRTRIEQLLAAGSQRARRVQQLLSKPGLLFSGIQFGITVANLLLGWIAERAMAASLEGVLEGTLSSWMTPVAAHTVAIVLALALITSLLMVLGELVPKTLGYERAEQVSLSVAWPMLIFIKVTGHVVQFFDWVSNRVVGMMGLEPVGSHSGLHSPEEIKLLVASIRKRGLLGEEQEEMIHSVFDLHEIRVNQVMTPRPDITCLPLTHDLAALLDGVNEEQLSRIPIYEGTPDHTVGVLYTKDLLRVMRERWKREIPYQEPFDLRSILREPIIVTETMSVNLLLEEYRSKRTQIALVVDEFGSFVGLVTLEDVLEEIVGEIEDEYDLEGKAIQKLSEGVLMVNGSLHLRALAADYDIDLPLGRGYETVAGFVLAHLGFIPKGGESLVDQGYRFTVASVEGRRIAQVKIEKVSLPSEPAKTSALPKAEVNPAKSLPETGHNP